MSLQDLIFEVIASAVESRKESFKRIIVRGCIVKLEVGIGNPLRSAKDRNMLLIKFRKKILEPVNERPTVFDNGVVLIGAVPKSGETMASDIRNEVEAAKHLCVVPKFAGSINSFVKSTFVVGTQVENDKKIIGIAEESVFREADALINVESFSVEIGVGEEFAVKIEDSGDGGRRRHEDLGVETLQELFGAVDVLEETFHVAQVDKVIVGFFVVE